MSQNEKLDSNNIPHELLPIATPFNVLDNSIRYFKQTIPVNVYHFYLTDEISNDVSKYIDMINVLKTAEEHDKIFICLNNPGGSISTTIQIISAMRETRAQVITSLEGQACSAATMIFLCGHNCIVNKNCSFMIHTFSEWGGGKGNEQKSRMEFNNDYFLKLFNEVYLGFLSPEEIESVLNGTDIWMESEEVSLRLDAYDKFKQTQMEEEQKESAIDSVNSLQDYIKEIMTSNGLKDSDLKSKPKKATKKTTKKASQK